MKINNNVNIKCWQNRSSRKQEMYNHLPVYCNALISPSHPFTSAKKILKLGFLGLLVSIFVACWVHVVRVAALQGFCEDLVKGCQILFGILKLGVKLVDLETQIKHTGNVQQGVQKTPDIPLANTILPCEDDTYCLHYQEMREFKYAFQK